MKKKNSNEIKVVMDLLNLEFPNGKFDRDKMGHLIINPKTFPLRLKECSIRFDKEVRNELIRFLENPRKHNNKIYIETNVLKVTKEFVKLEFRWVLLPRTMVETKVY